MSKKTVSVLLAFLFFVNIALSPQIILADGGKSNLRPLSVAESKRPLNAAAFEIALVNHLINLYKITEDARLDEDRRKEAYTTFDRTLKLIAAAVNPSNNLMWRSGPMTEQEIKAALGMLSTFSSSPFDLEMLHRCISQAAKIRAWQQQVFKLGVERELQELHKAYDPIITQLEQLARQSGISIKGAVAVDFTTSPEAILLRVSSATREATPPDKIRTKIGQLEELRAGIVGNKFVRAAWVGDQHGQNAVLEEVIKAVEEGQIDEVIVHGDQFDRGSENIANFEALKKLKRILGDRAVFCFGNHDLFLIQALLLSDEEAEATWLVNGGDVLDMEFRDGGYEPRDLALWILKNFKFFHIDERGFLHLHAGIRMGDEGNPLISIEQLEKWQQRLEELQRDAIWEDAQGNLHFREEFIPEFKSLFDQDGVDNIVWDRMDKWVNKFFTKRVVIDESNKHKFFDILREYGIGEKDIENNWEKLLLQARDHGLLDRLGIQFEIEKVAEKKGLRVMDNFLAQLGVNGVVFGHEWQEKVFIVDNRIICLDVHRGHNGFLVFNGDGMKFHALADSQECLLASNAELVANIDGQLIRLKAALGEDASEDKARFAAVSYTAGIERKKMEHKLAKRQRNPEYEKASMRYNSGLLIGWGGSTFELFARQSTQMPGALRISNIKGLGYNIAKVITLSGEVGDSLLVEEGQDLRIGPTMPKGKEFEVLQDTRGNPLGYAFVVGNRVFNFKVVENELALVEQAEPVVEGKDFVMSRTISNRPDRVIVELGREDASETTIRQVQLELVTEEDLRKCLLEIIELMSIVPPRPALSAEEQQLNEERRLVVAMALALERVLTREQSAQVLLDESISLERLLERTGYTLKSCCDIYLKWRNRDINEFRRIRQEIADIIFLKLEAKRVYQKYFGPTPASAMNRLATRQDRGRLYELIPVRPAAPAGFTRPADRSLLCAI